MTRPGTTTLPARVPKQERSQRSFELVLQASAEVLIEEGYDGFTLQKVSARSGVSTGSIYARIDSKDDLIHILHAQVLEQRSRDFAELMDRGRQITSLEELIRVIFPGFCEVMRTHAPLTRPVMLRAAFDPALFETGRAHGQGVRQNLADLVLEHRGEITHPDPERAARLAVMITDNAVFRYLGFATLLKAPDMGDWDHLIEDIVDAVTRLLLGHLND